MPEFEIEVAADADVPGHASDATHNFATGSDLYVGYLTGGLGPAENLAFAARFRDIPIPRGARVHTAVVRLEAAASVATVVVNARIDGLLAGDSVTPTHAEFDGGTVLGVGHGRATANRTVSQVTWSGIVATTAGEDFDTPDIRDVCQEIFSHPEWVKGHAITLFIGDEDHESDQENWHYRSALRSGVGPRLLVSYSVSADPARIEVSLGAIPRRLEDVVGGRLRQMEPSQVE